MTESAGTRTHCPDPRTHARAHLVLVDALQLAWQRLQGDTSGSTPKNIEVTDAHGVMVLYTPSRNRGDHGVTAQLRVHVFTRCVFSNRYDGIEPTRRSDICVYIDGVLQNGVHGSTGFAIAPNTTATDPPRGGGLMRTPALFAP